ncbi:Putative carbonic anhydrase [Septoria linicola]|uniref:Carbonic anhydrase n=1 Tax=Septoria linicola TaxID=215465 RepID=A0A9Q9B0T3_9PEZI|nr:Putative carbonic anhydrase [Septoria linicola]
MSTAVSCSDARVEPTDFLKLQKGEAIIIRDAGARIDEGVFRSLSVMGTVAPMGLIAVIHHTDCGGVYISDAEVNQRLASRNPNHAHELPASFGTFGDIGLDESIRQDVAKLKAWRFLAPTTAVKGFALTLETGEI